MHHQFQAYNVSTTPPDDTTYKVDTQGQERLVTRQRGKPPGKAVNRALSHLARFQ